jgi:hypothetical protein
MAGHSRLKDGVASARRCPAIHDVAGSKNQDMDARDVCAKTRFALWRGHDESWAAAVGIRS